MLSGDAHGGNLVVAGQGTEVRHRPVITRSDQPRSAFAKFRHVPRWRAQAPLLKLDIAEAQRRRIWCTGGYVYLPEGSTGLALGGRLEPKAHHVPWVRCCSPTTRRPVPRKGATAYVAHPIDYALLPRSVSGRNPWISGESVSRIPYNYPYYQSHAQALHRMADAPASSKGYLLYYLQAIAMLAARTNSQKPARMTPHHTMFCMFCHLALEPGVHHLSTPVPIQASLSRH